MGIARSKIGIDCKDAYSLSAIYDLLKENTPCEIEYFDPELCYFRFLVDGNVTSEGINSLLNLSYEISIVKNNGGDIILFTGRKHVIGCDRDIINEISGANALLHTRPRCYHGKLKIMTPSFGDALRTELPNRDNKCNIALVCPMGLMIYQRPNRDPETGEAWNGNSIGELMYKYSNKGNIYKPTPKRQSRNARVKNCRKFAEATGMIVAEALWDDTKGIERILSQVFGKAIA